jgi:NAD(P)-dependent dehydrogenase (short-subunit alcohol dehydrogenase family)
MGALEGKVAMVAFAGSISEGSVVRARWSQGLAVDRDLAAAQEAQTVIASEGSERTAHRCDVSFAAEVDTMVAACLADYCRVDVLFNNVGIHVRR